MALLHNYEEKRVEQVKFVPIKALLHNYPNEVCYY
jgi:hypothetical protein